MKNRIYELNAKKLGELVDVVAETNTPNSIEELVSFIYAECSDKAHGVKHIHDVLSSAYELKRCSLNPNEVIAIIFHDVAVELGRNGHELNGQKYWNEFVVPYLTCKLDVEDIGFAIAEHRASFKGTFTSKLSELVSAADRGNPKSLDSIIKRSYTYAIDNGANHDDACLHALEHIKHKYSENGYANFPEIYREHYKFQLKKFFTDVENLSIEKVKNTMEVK